MRISEGKGRATEALVSEGADGVADGVRREGRGGSSDSVTSDDGGGVPNAMMPEARDGSSDSKTSDDTAGAVEATALEGGGRGAACSCNGGSCRLPRPAFGGRRLHQDGRRMWGARMGVC